MESFAQFQLDPVILKNLEKLGWTKPTPVQGKAMAPALEGRDLIALAETGSGKTAAYLLPLIMRHRNSRGTHTLVLAPTRELALQILQVLEQVAEHLNDVCGALLIGGADMSKQVRNLKAKPSFIIATPGRLNDHIRRRSIDLSQVKTVVLDEADRMLDMGFSRQIDDVLKAVPKPRQTLLISATFPNEIRKLSERILRAPIEVKAQDKERPPAVIKQEVVEVIAQNKNDKTLDLINAATGSVVIFARTKSRTNRLARYLEDYGVKVTRLHGDRTQGQRNKSIRDFKDGLVNVLVATDIAARGLDVPGISDVINYDLPMNAEDYVHRIGRTGRAGQQGLASTLVTPEDRRNWQMIAKRVGIKVTSMSPVDKPASAPKKSSRSSYRRGNTSNRQHRFGN